MDIAAIDRSATRVDGPVRAASPLSKLIAAALCLAAVLVSFNALVLTGIGLGLLAVAIWGRLPMRTALLLAAYPAMFALVFAFASAPSASLAATIVLKAACSALTAIVVILSTPYPQVFAPIQRITPGIVGDAMLMTYRATFLMLEKFSNLLRAVKLRSGVRGHSPIRVARASTSALGGLLLYSVDLAQRDYDIMRVRGYSGKLRISPMRSRNRGADVALTVLASMALATSAVWRVGSAALNQFSWIVLLPPLLLLVAAALDRRWNR